MNKSREKSMTQGNVWKVIILFAVPIFIGNLFQNLYNIVDTAIIGNVLGDNALAAMGVVAPLFSIVICFLMGTCNGFAVILAQNFGAGDYKSLRQNMSLIYVLSILIGLAVTAVCLICLRPILVALHTPDDIILQADTYMRIISSFSLVTMIYNMFSSALRAIGDSKTPLYFLIVSSLLNGVLDLVFMKHAGMGVEGAAYATVIAQGVSTVLCILYVWKKCELLKFSKKDLIWDLGKVKELLAMGISMSMVTVVFIGSVALQRGVNALGKTTITAHTAARKIHDVLALPVGTVSTSVATFVGQNMGMLNYERIFEGLKKGLFIIWGWCIIAVTVAFLFGRGIILSLTGTTNPEVVESAYLYLRINSVFYVALSSFMVVRSALQGMGEKLVPIMSSMTELILKFAAVPFIIGSLKYLGVCILEPITWSIGTAIVVIDLFRVRHKIGYRKRST